MRRSVFDPSPSCPRVMDSECSCVGSEFQTMGAATWKLRQTSWVLVRETSKLWRILSPTRQISECWLMIQSASCRIRCTVRNPVRDNFIQVCFQLHGSTQPGHPFVGRRNEYRINGGDAVQLAVQTRNGSYVGGRWNCVIPLLHTDHAWAVPYLSCVAPLC